MSAPARQAGGALALERPPGLVRTALHLGALWALAFAQPLLGLLGDNAQFFVARGNTASDILVFAFGYALVPPFLAALAVWALGRVRPPLGSALQLALIALLVGAFCLPVLGDALSGSAISVLVAVLVGVAAAVAYARVPAVRMFVTVLSPAPMIVLVLFVVLSPVWDLVRPGEASGSIAGPARSSTPIVQVILDELPESTLAGPDGASTRTCSPTSRASLAAPPGTAMRPRSRTARPRPCRRS